MNAKVYQGLIIGVSVLSAVLNSRAPEHYFWWLGGCYALLIPLSVLYHRELRKNNEGYKWYMLAMPLTLMLAIFVVILLS